ncbi:MAG: hypothetical protein KA282_03480 [Clostridia bacterium]|nr:hypothetical protein [Clostridia bacterium]
MILRRFELREIGGDVRRQHEAAGLFQRHPGEYRQESGQGTRNAESEMPAFKYGMNRAFELYGRTLGLLGFGRSKEKPAGLPGSFR